MRDDQLPLAWVVPEDARFTGCAPHEESTAYTGGTFRRPAPSVIRCERCQVQVNRLIYLDGQFRCRDEVECEKYRTGWGRGYDDDNER